MKIENPQGVRRRMCIEKITAGNVTAYLAAPPPHITHGMSSFHPETFCC